jgi:hypothetical protein
VKILIAYDGSEGADKGIDDLILAGLPGGLHFAPGRQMETLASHWVRTIKAARLKRAAAPTISKSSMKTLSSIPQQFCERSALSPS